MLVEPLRGQLYQAPVSKYFLASAIVSGFGDCIWDGSSGRAFFGWPFLQTLLHTLHFSLEIKTQLKLQIESLSVQKGYVIQKLLQIAEFSLEEEDILDKEGNLSGKKKLRDSGAGLKALEALCKYLGFSTPKTEDEYREAKIITIANLDDEKI